MKDRKSPFYAYRYLVTPVSQQISITQELNKSKEELMIDFVQSLSRNTKTEWTKGDKRFLFYGTQSEKNINIFKFAKETFENIYVEGEADIEIQGIKEAKYVLVIIDTEHQIILIERNFKVFQSINTPPKILTDFFRTLMLDYDYVVNIYPLATKRKFWHYVETADEIFQLSLVLNAPNMPFFGNQDTRAILKTIQESTNNEELDITLKNKEGELDIKKSVLGNWIDYVREVGGKYLLKFSKDGVMEIKTSNNDTAKTYIPKKKTDKFTEIEMGNIADKLNAMHNLETRDETDEE